MGASQALEIIHETTEFIVNKARDQDLIPLFAALSANFAARRAATQTFMQNYDTVSIALWHGLHTSINIDYVSPVLQPLQGST